MGVKSQAENSCKPSMAFWSWSPGAREMHTNKYVTLKVSPSSVFIGELGVLHDTLELKHSHVQGGAHGQRYSHPALCVLSLAGHLAPLKDHLQALPLVSRSSRVGAVEAMGEVPGTQKEARPPSSGLHNLPMSTSGWSYPTHHGPRHAGEGGHPVSSHTVRLPFLLLPSTGTLSISVSKL